MRAVARRTDIGERLPRTDSSPPGGQPKAPRDESIAGALVRLQERIGNASAAALVDSATRRADDGGLGTGRPLPDPIRERMEGRFGQDLSRVRLHVSDERTRELGATAYTRGDDVVVAPGFGDLSTAIGERTLAHELTHVVQQRRGGAIAALDPSAPHEREAAAVADRTSGGGGRVEVSSGTAVGVARQTAGAVDPAVEERTREMVGTTSATGRPLSKVEYETRKAELKKTMSSLASRGISEAEIGRESHRHQLEEVRGVAGTLSDWWNDVLPPYIGMWSNAMGPLRRAEALLAADDLRGAYRYLVSGYESLADAKRQWSAYMTATIEGAQNTITTLEVIRDGAIAIEVGLLTGGSGLVGGGVVGGTLGGVGAATYAASTSESPLGEATRGTLAEIANTGTIGNLRLAAHGVVGILYGTGEGLAGVAKSLANMFLHPLQFVDDLMKLPSVLDRLWAHRDELYQHFASLPPEEQAFQVGRLAGQIEAMLIAAEASKAAGTPLKEGGITFTAKVPQLAAQAGEVSVPTIIWVDRVVTISTAVAAQAVPAAAALGVSGNVAMMAKAASGKTSGGAAGGGGKPPKKVPKKEPPEQLTPGKSPLREFDIDRYGVISQGEFRVGDKLAGHEMLQNAWLKVKGFAQKRALGSSSRRNPSVALSKNIHDAVTLQQKALGLLNPAYLKTLSAAEVIELNALAMRRAGVPEPVIQILMREALQHAATLSH